MIHLCIEEHLPFGVVLIRRGVEAFGPLAEPHPVGCTAEIVQVETLAQGRLNIVAAGRERFRIASLDSQSRSYLVGKVEPYPLEVGPLASLEPQALDLRSWVASYLQLLVEIGGAQAEPPALPSEPVALANMAAAVLQCPPDEKQALLEAAHAGEMLAGLVVLFRREVALLQAMQSRLAGPDQGSFSSN